MEENYFTRETLKAALEAKGITTNAQAQPVIDAMIKKGAIIQGVNEPAPTLGSKLMERGKTVLSEVTAQPARDILKAGADTQGTERVLTGTEALLRTAQAPIRAIGAVGGAVGDVIGSGLEAIGADKLIGNAVQPVVSTSPIQKAMDAYKQLPQDTQDVLSSILNTANLPLGGVGASIAKSGLETGVKAVGDVTKAGAGAVADNSLVQGAGTVLKSIGESAKRIPDRMATNVAEKQATESAITSLPTKTAQTAVRDGVDIADVKDISNITRTPQVNKLIQTVKEYAGGNKKVDPIEVIGEETVKRFKDVVKQKKQIGAQLGEASKTIGILTKPELQTGVLSRLKEVSGLENLTSKNGVLDFSKTRLNTTLSKSDRTAIQEAYREATKWGDGEKAHQFRQTLFEVLGGKKKGKVEVTDTQEQAFEGIRKGLSDVIETKSPTYKTLSNEYRKIVDPIRELQKRLKTLDPNADDLTDANLGAGILARRITSTASSNADVRTLLKKLDSVGTTKGSSFKNTLEMQDMYNILNKYYDIAPKTGFQNLVKEGVGSDSVAGMVKETLKNVVGQSNAVRQKALENLLDELGVVTK